MTSLPFKPTIGRSNMLLTSVRVASSRIEQLERDKRALQDYVKMVEADQGLTSPYSTVWPWVALVSAFAFYVLHIIS